MSFTWHTPWMIPDQSINHTESVLYSHPESSSTLFSGNRDTWILTKKRTERWKWTGYETAGFAFNLTWSLIEKYVLTTFTFSFIWMGIINILALSIHPHARKKWTHLKFTAVTGHRQWLAASSMGNFCNEGVLAHSVHRNLGQSQEQLALQGLIMLIRDSLGYHQI